MHWTGKKWYISVPIRNIIIFHQDENAENLEQDEKQNEEEADDDGIEDKQTDEVESAKDTKVNCKSTLCDHDDENKESLNCKSTLCDHGEEGGEVQIEVTEAEVEEQVIEDDTVLNCQSTLCNHDEEKIADAAEEVRIKFFKIKSSKHFFMYVTYY